MTSKDMKKKWDKAKADAAKAKFKFNEWKMKVKTADNFSDKRKAKKELKLAKANLKKLHKEADYYRKQYIVLAKAEGKHISAVSVAVDEIKKQVKEKL